MKITDVTIVPLTAPYTWPNLSADDRNNGVRNCVWRLSTLNTEYSQYASIPKRA